MEDNLNIISEFADTIANTLKRFVELCREDKRRREGEQSEFAELQNELIKERKKRIELEEIVRQRAEGSAQNDPSLMDVLNNYEQRRRPKTPFLLFVADYRERILKEHPSLSRQKVTNIARIKWNLLNKEQQLAYQKKLQEINRAFELRDMMQNRNRNNNDQSLVKRQFGESEGEKENEPNQDEENGEGEINGETEQDQNNRESHPNTGEQQIQSTMLATLPEDQSVSNHQEAPKEKSAIENILDLFHTQHHPSQQNKQTHHAENNEINDLQPQLTDAPPPSNPSAVSNEPSLMMVDPATYSHPIVIPPTVQE